MRRLRFKVGDTTTTNREVRNYSMKGRWMPYSVPDVHILPAESEIEIIEVNEFGYVALAKGSERNWSIADFELNYIPVNPESEQPD